MPFISIRTIEHPSQTIFLTDDQIRYFDMKPGDQVLVKAGSCTAVAEIAGSPEGNYITHELLDSLCLPNDQDLRIKRDESGNLQIGPLIGIMISRTKQRRLPPFTSQNILLRSFLNYSGYAKCLAYVFSPSEVDTANHRVTAFYLKTNHDGTKEWHRRVFPLPDVVYDRILFRTIERKKSTKRVTSYLLDNNIAYFNPKFLNKWETSIILMEEPCLVEHLPDTKKYDGLDNLLLFLEQYKVVYVKPANGSLGKGIIQLSRLPDGYHYHYRKGKTKVKGVWVTPQELSAGLEKIIDSRVYIMQQGLDLLTYQDRVFDIRVLFQKDLCGQWVNTATVARVASEGSIFPNVAAGGKPLSIEVLWQDLSPTDWLTSSSCAAITKVSLAAAATLEKKLGTFGELGLDIGLDAKGKVWIIEINSKPSRKVFPNSQQHLKKMSIKLPIDFATYLAGFTPEQRWVKN